MNDFKDSFKNWLDSEKGKERIAVFVKKMRTDEETESKQLERFHHRYFDKKRFSEIVEKIISKYNSNEYKYRWHKRCIEPLEDLYNFLLNYAMRYGKKCNKTEIKKYGNMFTVRLYSIHGYYFNEMRGQGTIVLVSKKR